MPDTIEPLDILRIAPLKALPPTTNSIHMHHQFLAQASDTGTPIVPILVGLAIMLFFIAAMWKVFTKAGEPGWASLIPIYNLVVMLKIAGKPVWWIILFLIPLVNIIISVLVALGIAERFGKGAGFAIGLVFLPFIFYPILGFGSATYGGSETA